MCLAKLVRFSSSPSPTACSVLCLCVLLWQNKMILVKKVFTDIFYDDRMIMENCSHDRYGTTGEETVSSETMSH